MDHSLQHSSIRSEPANSADFAACAGGANDYMIVLVEHYRIVDTNFTQLLSEFADSKLTDDDDLDPGLGGPESVDALAGVDARVVLVGVAYLQRALLLPVAHPRYVVDRVAVLKMKTFDQIFFLLFATMPRDKMNNTVGFVNCFLGASSVYLPSYTLPCCQGKSGGILGNECVQYLCTRNFFT